MQLFLLLKNFLYFSFYIFVIPFLHLSAQYLPLSLGQGMTPDPWPLTPTLTLVKKKRIKIVRTTLSESTTNTIHSNNSNPSGCLSSKCLSSPPPPRFSCDLQWLTRNPAFSLQVTWIRKKDVHVLTVGLFRYTTDDRFRALHSESSNNWTLRIASAQLSDSGTYECQVSTEPKLSKSFTLVVVGRLPTRLLPSDFFSD